jgi:hypothetical protein
MATFTVDPASLHGLSSSLSDIHSRMSGMKGVASGYEGLLGGSDLDGQVTSFCSTWSYGIGKLGDDMTKIIQHLDYAADGYSQAEQHIVAGAKGGS